MPPLHPAVKATSSHRRAPLLPARPPGTPSLTPIKQVFQQLYEVDVVSEEAFTAWAGEKAHADEAEKAYLRRAAPFLEWLRTADDDDDDEESEEGDSD